MKSVGTYLTYVKFSKTTIKIARLAITDLGMSMY